MSPCKDLIILVPCKDIEKTIEGILGRPQALGIRDIEFEIIRHIHRDPGVYQTAHEILRNYTEEFNYALAILDCEFGGSPSDPEEIVDHIQKNLDLVGWKDRSAVIAINPEVEIWVWNDSPILYTQIGAPLAEIHKIILEVNPSWWIPEQAKPVRPKEVLDEILRRNKLPRSSSLYGTLAEKVSLTKCTDGQFNRLRAILQEWFP